MSKRTHTGPERHESFADIVKSVASDESIVVSRESSSPVPGPFDQGRWTDDAGVEWRLRHAGRGRLINLINDTNVPVREFDRWTAEVRTLNAQEGQEVIEDLMAGRHEIEDFCEGMDIVEARNEEHQSEVWIGRI